MTLSLISGAFAADAPAPVAETTAASVAEAPYPVPQDKMMTDTLVFLFLMFGIFYFLLIRPQQKRLKAHRAMLEELKKGDKVVTAGGIVGTVVKIESQGLVQVEIAPNVRVQVTRAMISEMLDATALPASTANDN